MHRSIDVAVPRAAIALFVLLAASPAALAQPSIATTSGVWSHKATVTIAGSGFGAKASAEPVVWDDASGLNVTDKWDAGWPNCAGNSNYNLAYRTPSQAGRNIPLPHSHETKYISGAHFGPNPGPDCSYAVMLWKVRTIASFPAYSFSSWYQRADDDWHFNNASDDNFKTFAYSSGVGPYNLPNNWYLEYNPVPISPASIPTWHLNDDATGTLSQSLQSPNQNGHSFYWGAAVNPMGGTWSKIEMETKYTDQNDGYIRMWENGVLVMDYQGSTDHLPGTQRTEGIGGYARDYPDTSNWRFFSDVYLDYSRARVVLGDAPTLAASTIREVQVPTAWSDSSISVSVNLGAFTDQQTAYLYVLDADGNSNAAGVPINTDPGPSGPPDTIVPTVSLTTPTDGAPVSGLVQVAAAASDNVGVAGVTLRVDGVSLGVEDTTAPYSVAWNSATAPNGSHVITALARDAAGNQRVSAPITVTANNVSAPTTTGLVASYAFDDGSGTVLSDASGYGHAGTISGGAAWTAGHHGSALSFDGVDDIVTIADAAAFDLGIGMTLEAWVNPSSLTGWQTVVMKTRPPGPGEPDGGLSYALYANNGTPNPAATVNTGGGDLEAPGPSPVPADAWSHLAATYDGTMLRLYVDGTEQSSHAVSGPLLSSTRALFLGGNDVWGEYFAGLIDDVRIYNRALSAAEIQVDMATPVVDPPPPDTPTLTTIAPSAVVAGGPAFTVTVTGTGFAETSRVKWDGAARATTVDSATQLRAAILAADISTPGTHSLTVVTPAPGGGFSNGGTLTVTALAPTLTTIAPTTVAMGGLTFTLTVTGTGFVASSSVQWDGMPRVTTFDSATQLFATIPAADIVSPGTRSLTVVTPAPGGGTSTAVVLSVTSPTPTITTIAPTSVAVGGPAFSLLVTGTGFVASSTVEVDGTPRVTTFNSATQLSVAILAADIASPGTHTITVVTPAPGGGTSTAVVLQVGPTLTAGATSVAPGGTMSVTVGNGPGNLRDWVGLYCPTTATDTSFTTWKYLSDTQAAPMTGLTAATVTFTAPTTLGATCQARLYANNGFTRLATSGTVTVANPVPTLTNLIPTSVAAGSVAFTLTVTGSGFVATSKVQWDGAARVTTFVSATQVTVTIPSTDVAALGTHTITVVTPTPGGGVSNGATLAVTAPPAPTIATIAPTAVAVGGPAFTLTVTGTGFVGTSSVLWDGAARATTVDSATQLRAMIPVADLASPGTHMITVVTPAPGGGTSTAVVLQVGPSLTAGPPSVAPGGTMSVTVGNGPGNLRDWVGLYCPTTAGDTSFTAWKFLSDTQTPPTMGLTAALVTFTAPTTLGATCEARLYANSGFTRLATSGTVTVANPVPTLTNLMPTSVVAGSAAFTLTVTGTGFAAGAGVQLDGAARVTTVVSPTQARVTIPTTDLGTLGTHTITVVNPMPGGGVSNGGTLTVTAPPPVPTLTTIAPTSIGSGGPAFTLTVTGTGFIATSSVQWDGVARATTFDSATQLRAAISAADIASAGTHSLTVVTPAPGGGTSNVVMLPVVGPTLAAGATSVVAGGTMTFIIGNGPGNLRDWVGLYCPTTAGDTIFATWKFLSDTQTPPTIGLTAAMVTFTAPTTLGPTCEARLYANSGFTRLATSGTVTVANPVPTLTSLMPPSVVPGSAAFTLTVTGSGFVAGAGVQLDGLTRATTFVSPTQVTVAILSTDVATLGTHTITVVTPAPGGGTSNAVMLPVIAPTLTAGASSVAPGGTVSVTVGNGPGNPGDWVGLYCPTTAGDTSFFSWKYLNDTKTIPTMGLTTATVTLTAPTTLAATCEVRLFANSGYAKLATSGTVAVVNPVPTLTSLLPTSVGAGSAAFTLTVTGSGFVAGSGVQLDGAARATTFVSATQLRAVILAADLASSGAHSLTVVTPAPGGGTSTAVVLPVLPPTLTAGASSVAPGGTVSITVGNGPGNPGDWVGLYCPTTAGDTSFFSWKYLNDTKTIPTMGLTTATVTLTAPATLGATCEARLFANSGYAKLATSGTVTVATTTDPP